MPPRETWPQIISHRGASGYVPEHSLNAYQLAIDLGTDYIEPDLCLSKDGVFVDIHDVTLDDVTDVAQHTEFQDRYTTYVVDGSNVTGYFVQDFTVAELKTLRLKQRLNTRTTLYDGLLIMPTLSEIISLISTNYLNSNKTIGMYIELKHPAYYNSLGLTSLPVEDLLVQQLSAAGYQTSNVSKDLRMVNPVVVQCFEADSLKKLKTICDLPLVLLVQIWDPSMLVEIATYANGIGPEKSYFADLPLNRALAQLTQAHELSLVVHPWTFRQEPKYVSTKFKNDPEIEAAYFYCCLKIDAVFSEFPDRMRETIRELNTDPVSLCAKGGC